MYENLNKYLEKKGMKVKAENNLIKDDSIKAEFELKEKTKALTQAERLDRIERLLGI